MAHHIHILLKIVHEHHTVTHRIMEIQRSVSLRHFAQKVRWCETVRQLHKRWAFELDFHNLFPFNHGGFAFIHQNCLFSWVYGCHRNYMEMKSLWLQFAPIRVNVRKKQPADISWMAKLTLGGFPSSHMQCKGTNTPHSPTYTGKQHYGNAKWGINHQSKNDKRKKDVPW